MFIQKEIKEFDILEEIFHKGSNKEDTIYYLVTIENNVPKATVLYENGNFGDKYDLADRIKYTDNIVGNLKTDPELLTNNGFILDQYSNISKL